MKIKLLLLLSYLLSACDYAPAQTNTNAAPTNTPPTSLLPGGVTQVGGDILAFLKDAQPYFTNGLRLEVGPLYANKQWGALIDVQFPLTSLATNGQISIGFAAAYLGNSFYDASLGVNLGTTWQVPVIGKVYTWGESGPGYNLSKKSAIVQSFAGATKGWNIPTNFPVLGGSTFAISVGVGKISDTPGAAYMGGLSLSKKF